MRTRKNKSKTIFLIKYGNPKNQVKLNDSLFGSYLIDFSSSIR